MDRRSFLRTGLIASATAAGLGRSFIGAARASHPAPQHGTGPYQDLLPPDANGLELPARFSSRVIATTPDPVPGTNYPWRIFPDGAATFADPSTGGWILTVNSEVPGIGGASAIRFDATGAIAGAYSILAGTTLNCAGGPTPWGTWLSCEEHDAGLVWECDPTGAAPALPRPALGTFKHEAAAVDPTTRHVYLTEDQVDGLFYRYTPADPANPLLAGTLAAARVAADGTVTWATVPNPNVFHPTPTRKQVQGARTFNGGEGIWFDPDRGIVFFTTKGDDRLWAYDVAANRIEIWFDSDDPRLDGVDNITVSRSGDIYICEDHGGSNPLKIVMITPEGVVAPVVRISNQPGSELTGAAFSPDGSRLYLSSQRGGPAALGITYEVSGPFRQ